MCFLVIVSTFEYGCSSGLTYPNISALPSSTEPEEVLGVPSGETAHYENNGAVSTFSINLKTETRDEGKLF